MQRNVTSGDFFLYFAAESLNILKSKKQTSLDTHAIILQQVSPYVSTVKLNLSETCSRFTIL